MSLLLLHSPHSSGPDLSNSTNVLPHRWHFSSMLSPLLKSISEFIRYVNISELVIIKIGIFDKSYQLCIIFKFRKREFGRQLCFLFLSPVFVVVL
jgi:hypothetical protein